MTTSVHDTVQVFNKRFGIDNFMRVELVPTAHNYR